MLDINLFFFSFSPFVCVCVFSLLVWFVCCGFDFLLLVVVFLLGCVGFLYDKYV